MNLYKEVSDQIIERIKQCEKEGIPFHWVKPWSGGPFQPVEYTKGTPYAGINSVLLENGEYITYKRLMELKGSLPEEQAEAIKIRKGSYKVPIYFFSQTTKKDENGEPVLDKDGKPVTRWFMKKYYAYHREDIEGLPSKFPAKHYTHTPIEHEKNLTQYIMAYVKAEGLKVEVVPDGTTCHYRPTNHSVRVPAKEGFKSQYEYYGAILHELIHSTSKGLGRKVDGSFASTAYCKEELVAEMGSQMLLARFGIVAAESENSIAYLRGWVEHLNEHTTELTKAACLAEKAASYFIQQAEKQININTREAGNEYDENTIR